MAVDNFVHLHVHTEYSKLDGAAKVKPLVAEAVRLGMPAIGMSDHGNMFGAYDMWKTAKDARGGGADIKPIIGIEAYVAPESRFTKKPVFWGGPSNQRSTSGDGDEEEGGKDVSGRGAYTHITMQSINATGLRNLFKLSSVASFEGFYKAPRMDRELIAQHSEGIVATTGCPSGEVQTRLRLGQFDEAVKTAAFYQDVFGKDKYFVEVMDHGLGLEKQVREGLLELSRKLDIPLLATNDSHYVTEDQAPAHDAILAIGVGRNLDDPKRFRLNGSGYYVKSAEQMREVFRELPQACDSSLLVAEMVAPDAYDEVFAENKKWMPQFPVPEGETQASWLRKEVYKGARLRFGENLTQEYKDRIELELELMERLDFSAYFLIVGDICQYAKNNGIALGPGRGSATGSMVAYCLRITELDPIEHKLLFERFLNPERISPPDIDLDFADDRREDMLRYVTELYGEANVAQVNTFGRIKTKAAIKDSSRILGFPFQMGERITKALPPAVMAKDIPLYGIFDEKHERYKEAGEIRDLYNSDRDVAKVIDTARGIEGMMRGFGVHACAVIIGSEPLTNAIPLHRRDKDGAIITGFEYPSCESMGLLKMDFLGLRNLTVTTDALRMIKETHGVDIDLNTLPLHDEKTFELMSRGDTLGVFQLDNSGMRALLKQMGVTKFGDIAAVLALYRPGPMEANSHINYAERKNGRQEATPIHPELAEVLAPILDETYGLVVYQEQVMAIARNLAGYSLGGADILRRAMGKKKKEELDKQHETFFAGMAANGYSAQAAQAVWDVLVPFSSYGFNKSHTAGYGIVSFWTAYLKANYPAEYMAALLTSVGDKKDTMALYLAECRRMGIKVLPPDVNDSAMGFHPVGSDVRFGLGAIRNVGENVVEAIIAARKAKGRYSSFNDFLDKVPIVVCNKRTIESLIKAGAFDSLGHPRRALVEVHERAVDSIVGLKKQEAIGQDSLFGGLDDDGPAASFGGVEIRPDAPEWDQTVKLNFEREMLGLYVSSHPLDGAEMLLARNRDVSIAELLESGRTEGFVGLCGLITSVTRKITKQGNTWAIITLEDHDAAVEVLFFPNQYQLYADYLREDECVAISGSIKERDGSLNLSGQDLKPLELAGLDSAQTVVMQVPARRINETSIRELRRILEAHPGSQPAQLNVIGTDAIVRYALPAFPVNTGNGFFSDLKMLFGPSVIVV
ncbi:MAG: DNA polymerase III subunit alpha [Catenulispora sp.]|nr:DNA polymerase III subunit alpha [Catenulispora sp.]